MRLDVFMAFSKEVVVVVGAEENWLFIYAAVVEVINSCFVNAHMGVFKSDT